MDAAAEDNALPISDLVLRREEVCDDEHLDRVAGLGLAKSRPSKPILAIGWQTNALQMHDAVGVCVRVAVREVDLIVVMSELHCE